MSTGRIEIRATELATLSLAVNWVWKTRYGNKNGINTGMDSLEKFVDKHGEDEEFKKMLSYYTQDKLQHIHIAICDTIEYEDEKMANANIGKPETRQVKTMTDELMSKYKNKSKAIIIVEDWGYDTIINTVKILEYCKNVITDRTYMEMLRTHAEFYKLADHLRDTIEFPAIMESLYKIKLKPRKMIKHNMVVLAPNNLDSLIKALSIE